MLIGAFTLQGIQVGPLFIGENLLTWNVMMIGLVAANLVMFLVMWFAIRYIAKVITIPKCLLFPGIMTMCVVGAHASNNGVMFDVWTQFIFGLGGFFGAKLGLGIAPFIIGCILGPSTEVNFVKSLESFGTLSIFFSKSPIALVLWVLIAVSVAYAIYNARCSRQRASQGGQALSGCLRAA